MGASNSVQEAAKQVRQYLAQEREARFAGSGTQRPFVTKDEIVSWAKHFEWEKILAGFGIWMLPDSRRQLKDQVPRLDPMIADNDTGYTLLHIAASQPGIPDIGEIAWYLLQVGVDPNALCVNKVDGPALVPASLTALDLACEYGNLEVVQALVDDPRTDVNMKTGSMLCTALTKAVVADSRRVIQIIDALLDKGADINARDSQGNTPLMVAANARVVRHLIERGADVDAVNASGQTLLSMAVDLAERGRADSLYLLLNEPIQNADGSVRLDATELEAETVNSLRGVLPAQIRRRAEEQRKIKARWSPMKAAWLKAVVGQGQKYAGAPLGPITDDD